MLILGPSTGAIPKNRQKVKPKSKGKSDTRDCPRVKPEASEKCKKIKVNPGLDTKLKQTPICLVTPFQLKLSRKCKFYSNLMQRYCIQDQTPPEYPEKLFSSDSSLSSNPPTPSPEVSVNKEKKKGRPALFQVLPLKKDVKKGLGKSVKLPQ